MCNVTLMPIREAKGVRKTLTHIQKKEASDRMKLCVELFGIILWVAQCVREQFDEAGEAGVETLFADKKLHVVYHNPAKLDYGAHRIEPVQINGGPVPFEWQSGKAVLARETVAALADHQLHRVDVKHCER